MGAELFPADGQTDIAMLKFAFRNFANAPRTKIRLSKIDGVDMRDNRNTLRTLGDIQKSFFHYLTPMLCLFRPCCTGAVKFTIDSTSTKHPDRIKVSLFKI